MITRTKQKTIFLIYTAVLLSSKIGAADYGFSIFSTLSHSDNLTQSDPKSSGSSLNTGLTFDFGLDDDYSWTIELSGQFAREVFSIDELSNQDTKLLLASANYEAKGSNFALLVRDDISQKPQNRFATQSIGNVADVNILTVRPSYFFKFTPIDRLFLEATYMKTSTNNQSLLFEDELSFDFISKGGNIRYEKKINATNDLALVVETNDTEFEEFESLPTVDFTQDDIFIRWVVRGRLNLLQLELGESNVEDQFSREFDTNLAGLLYKRILTQTQEIVLNVRDGFLVTLNDNFTDNTLSANNQSSDFGSAQEFKKRTLTYTKSDKNLGANFNLFDFDFQSVAGTSNESRQGIELGISYSLVRLLSTQYDTSISFTYSRSKDNFETTIGEDLENTIDTYRLRYDFAQSTAMSYFLEYRARNSDSDGRNSRFIVGDSNTISIGFIYAPFGRSSE